MTNVGAPTSHLLIWARIQEGGTSGDGYHRSYTTKVHRDGSSKITDLAINLALRSSSAGCRRGHRRSLAGKQGRNLFRQPEPCFPGSRAVMSITMFDGLATAVTSSLMERWRCGAEPTKSRDDVVRIGAARSVAIPDSFPCTCPGSFPSTAAGRNVRFAGHQKPDASPGFPPQPRPGGTKLFGRPLRASTIRPRRRARGDLVARKFSRDTISALTVWPSSVPLPVGDTWRGPELHHRAEAIVEALLGVAARMDSLRGTMPAQSTKIDHVTG